MITGNGVATLDAGLGHEREWVRFWSKFVCKPVRGVSPESSV